MTIGRKWVIVLLAALVMAWSPVPVEARCDLSNENQCFQVIISHDGYYSLWCCDEAIPLYWNSTGKEGTKQDCLNYIDEVWSDMRPLSLRKKICEYEGRFWDPAYNRCIPVREGEPPLGPPVSMLKRWCEDGGGRWDYIHGRCIYE